MRSERRAVTAFELMRSTVIYACFVCYLEAKQVCHARATRLLYGYILYCYVLILLPLFLIPLPYLQHHVFDSEHWTASIFGRDSRPIQTAASIDNILPSWLLSDGLMMSDVAINRKIYCDTLRGSAEYYISKKLDSNKENETIRTINWHVSRK